MNDCLFVIDKPPRPSNDDVQPDGWVKHIAKLDYKHDEAMSNARLIAAAPDLVAALGPFAEFARMMDDLEHIKKTPDDAVIHPGLTVGHFRRARAAIAKATGEA
jgi:hypothetical protein